MLPQLRLFDLDFLSSLLQEFRNSMRDLLVDLCEELRNQYRHQAKSLQLPLDHFRLVGERLELRDYSTWRVVGWIEELNDLVYFIDLREQLLVDRNPRDFAADLLAECQEKFYENSYQDDIFPSGLPESAGLAPRLSRLCARLARQVTQESLFLVPGLPCLWLGQTKAGSKSVRTVPCDLGANFERAQLPGRVYVGLEGAYLDPPASIRKELAAGSSSTRFLIQPDGIRIAIGRKQVPLWSREGQPSWHWRSASPCSLGFGEMTLGEALIFRKDLTPSRVVQPQPDLVGRLQRALTMIEQAWPDGAKILTLLTSRIVPLNAKGVVSFSYRHRPGLSFINTFDRDQLDLIDDLVHENSHHHLNLLLRKYVLYRGDHNQEIFYSPWRRSLRPLRGILHATFTFTMGAILFERLSSWAARVGQSTVRKAGLSKQDVLRARSRCLEEIDSVLYSLRDLGYAATELGWMTTAGMSLMDSLRREIEGVSKRIAPYEASVLRSRYGVELKWHRKTLTAARKTYRPVG